MSDDTPNDRGYKIVKDMLERQEHNREFGSPYPKHTGPQSGPNDLMVGGILIGMAWALLSSGGGILEGVIGAVVGGAAGLLLKFVLNLPFTLLRLIVNAFRPKLEAQQPRKYASDSIDWKAKRRAKYDKK